MNTVYGKKSEEAFTLTEVVVAIFLLTVVWLSAVNVLVISRSSGSLANHKTQAIYYIQRTLEDLRKKTFSTISSGTTTISVDTRGTPDNTEDDLIGTQVITVTTPDTYYKKVLVEVTWAESFFGKSKICREYGGTYIANDPQAN